MLRFEQSQLLKVRKFRPRLVSLPYGTVEGSESKLSLKMKFRTKGWHWIFMFLRKNGQNQKRSFYIFHTGNFTRKNHAFRTMAAHPLQQFSSKGKTSNGVRIKANPPSPTRPYASRHGTLCSAVVIAEVFTLNNLTLPETNWKMLWSARVKETANHKWISPSKKLVIAQQNTVEIAFEMRTKHLRGSEIIK